MKRERRFERGAAVIMAIGVAALAALAATAILTVQSVWARERELRSDYVQARALTAAAIDWSRAVLAQDRRAGTLDYLGEVWALDLAPVRFENGTAAGRIVDQQGLFNLNNLVSEGQASPRHVLQLTHLLTTLGLPASLVDALLDWMDADDRVRSAASAEDAYYAALDPPYVAANRALADVAELALVRGFDEAVRARLEGYVTALPRPTAVNVNTAPPEVLAAVLGGLDAYETRGIVARRVRSPFRDVADVVSAIPSGAGVRNEDVAFGSEFFMVSVQTSVGESRAGASALLARPDGAWPRVLWRKHQ